MICVAEKKLGWCSRETWKFVSGALNVWEVILQEHMGDFAASLKCSGPLPPISSFIICFALSTVLRVPCSRLAWLMDEAESHGGMADGRRGGMAGV